MDYLMQVAAVSVPTIAFQFSLRVVSPNLAWYNSLRKPVWLLPMWMFDLSWSVLYAIIGYASFLVWKTGGGFQGAARIPLLVYGLFLVVTLTWSPIFFKFMNLKWAYYMIILAQIVAAFNGYLFYKVEPSAGLMYLPLLLWFIYEICVTYSFYKNNVFKNEKRK